MTTRVRFAPSPTGYLHIGGVRTALFNWLWARKTKGVFVLRIEDTDQERSTPESRQVILDSMRWLGLEWDEGPEKGGNYGPYEQMARLAIYREHYEKLISKGAAFRCYCTKEELDAQRAALKAKDPKATFRYPGTCRNRTDEPDKPFVVRFKAPTAGELVYHDKVFGEVRTPNAAQQDFVLVRSDGVPLYNFGAVVDDLTMEISLVVRGRDHMVNTPPQILIYEALGAKPPDFAHLPMMLAPNGEKLSKRHGAVSVGEYQSQGYLPDAVLNYLVRFGWSHGDQEVFSMTELIDAFNWEACGKGDGKFDAKKFLAIQHAHMKDLDKSGKPLTSVAQYTQMAREFLGKRGISDVDDAKLEKAMDHGVRARARTFVEAADMLDYLFREPPVLDEKAAPLLVPASAPRLAWMLGELEMIDSWTLDAIKKITDLGVAREKELGLKDVMQPARIALSGRTNSIGLAELMDVIGRDASLARIRSAIARAETHAS
ncbi:MAG: glutamate--tRNA ligase [Polyangiaceae bacterium]